MKGKHAASATAKRLRDAEARIAELDAQIAAESAEATARERELEAKIVRLNGRLVREVAALADARVEAAKREAAQELAATRRSAQETTLGLVLMLLKDATVNEEDGTLNLLPHEWAEITKATGLTAGEFAASLGESTNRHGRRTSARMLQRKLEAATPTKTTQMVHAMLREDGQ